MIRQASWMPRPGEAESTGAPLLSCMVTGRFSALPGRRTFRARTRRKPAAVLPGPGRWRAWTRGTSTPVCGMAWENLPVSQGSFSSAAPGSRIEGRFHGDRHQEAGGVVEHGTIVGAFGAVRG